MYSKIENHTIIKFFSCIYRTPDDDATGRLVGSKHPPRTPCTERLLPGMLYCAVPRRAAPRRVVPCHAMPCHATLCHAGHVALRRGTVYCAILSRVAWLVVSFLYSFVGKSAASLVFKRRQREGRWKERVGRWEGETATR